MSLHLQFDKFFLDKRIMMILFTVMAVTWGHNDDNKAAVAFKNGVHTLAKIYGKLSSLMVYK